MLLQQQQQLSMQLGSPHVLNSSDSCAGCVGYIRLQGSLPPCIGIELRVTYLRPAGEPRGKLPPQQCRINHDMCVICLPSVSRTSSAASVFQNSKG
jgi:hypothetical protein